MRRETQRLLGAARAMRKAALHGLPRATRERLAPHPPGVRTKASRPTGSNAGATISTSRAKPGMAAQLGLPAIPVEREYLQSWKTLRAAWERCRFVAEIPEALDTDAIGRVCEFRVQGERVAHPRQLSEVRQRVEQFVVVRVIDKARNRERVLWMKDVRVRRVIDDDGLRQVSPQTG